MSSRFERIVLGGLLLVSPMALTAQAGTNDGASVTDTVVAGKMIVYKVTLKGGQRNTITLRGDGASDLDLQVYDMEGKLVIEDTRFLEGGSLWFEPPQDVEVQVVVRNNGRQSSEYHLQLTVTEREQRLEPDLRPQPEPDLRPTPQPEPAPQPEPRPEPIRMPMP
jgi:hypothetical protein